MDSNEFNLKKFLVVQKFLFKIHNTKDIVRNSLLGINIGTETYFNDRFVCLKDIPLCESYRNKCPCKIKFLFRRAKIDLDSYKPVSFENLSVSLDTLINFGCLESVIITHSERFDYLHKQINEAINFVQATLMCYLAL